MLNTQAVMRHFFSVLFLTVAVCVADAQTLVEAQFLGQRTAAQLIAETGVPFIQFGARYYRIQYMTSDAQGQPVLASGLLAAPISNNPDAVYPRLVYQHGTSSSKLDVPSFNVLQGGEGQIGLIFAGLGYVSFLPDYIGLGVSPGFHLYVHADTEASCALDMMRACADFCFQSAIYYNAQLFITGYSQGGHAAMALHRAVEQMGGSEFGEVTAAAHLSGPYSISGVMRDLILSDSVYFYPAYLPNTALSYQTAYGNLFGQLDEVFRMPYAAMIGQFYAGQINLGQLNARLIDSLVAREGACIPTRMLQPDIIAAVNSDPMHPINVALRDNDVYSWSPEAPTRIFYCMADDQVPFRNSIVARDTMLALGALSLVVQDLNPSANHGECVVPALTATVFFFASFQQITSLSISDLAPVFTARVFPNPAQDRLWVETPSDRTSRLWLYDARGRLAYDLGRCQGLCEIPLVGQTPGVYFLLAQSGEYQILEQIWIGR